MVTAALSHDKYLRLPCPSPKVMHSYICITFLLVLELTARYFWFPTLGFMSDTIAFLSSSIFYLVMNEWSTARIIINVQCESIIAVLPISLRYLLIMLLLKSF